MKIWNGTINTSFQRSRRILIKTMAIKMKK